MNIIIPKKENNDFIRVIEPNSNHDYFCIINSVRSVNINFYAKSVDYKIIIDTKQIDVNKENMNAYHSSMGILGSKTKNYTYRPKIDLNITVIENISSVLNGYVIESCADYSLGPTFVYLIIRVPIDQCIYSSNKNEIESFFKNKEQSKANEVLSRGLLPLDFE